MTRGWTTVRVFISSTFRDMHAERDHLVKVVFPALREKLDAHRIHLVDIDLRWGVTREEAESAGALGLCLSQIDECRPFFVAILGERYGWIPAAIPPGAVARYGWLSEYAGRSVTELEIIHGVLREPGAGRRSFFCVRDPAALEAIPSDLRRTVFVETNVENARRLEELKRAIRASGLPLFDGYPAQWAPNALDASSRSRGRFTGLDEFGRRMHDQILAMIGAELERPGLGDASLLPALDPLEAQRDLENRFLESRLRAYVGRDDVHERLLAYVDGAGEGPCVLSGGRGSGKSAALARLVAGLRSREPAPIVISHFSEAQQGAAPLRDALARLCRELLAAGLEAQKQARLAAESDVLGWKQRDIDQEFAIPDRVEEVAATFARFLRMAGASAERLVVVLDLGKHVAPEGVTSVWLPGLPPNVRFVLTAGAEIESIVKSRPHVAIDLQPLSEDERRTIIAHVPSLSAKRLDAKQTRLLLAKPATASPLFLRVALEELRGFGSYEQLTERIRALPEGHAPGAIAGALERLRLKRRSEPADPVAELFAQMLDRLAIDFDPAIVQHVLTGLCTAYRGLSERELRDLVALESRGDDLFPLLRQLRPYLVSRGEVLGIEHFDLRQAATARWLADEEKQRAAHRWLADFFEAQPFRLEDGNPNTRKVDELPYHLMASQDYDRAFALLTNIQYVEAKIDARLACDLTYEAGVVAAYSGEPGDLLRDLPEVIARSLATLEQDPSAGFQCLWNTALAPTHDPATIGFHTLLENWRNDPGRMPRHWIRSLRPDPEGLGAPPVFQHGDPIDAIAVSQNGRLIAAAGGTKISIWDSRQRALRHVIHTAAPVTSVDLYGLAPSFEQMLDAMPLYQQRLFLDALGSEPFVERIAYATEGRVQIVDLLSGNELARFEHAAGPDAAMRVAFSPAAADGSEPGLRNIKGHLIAVTAGSELAVWNAQTGARVHMLSSGFAGVDDLRWSPDGSRVIAAGWDQPAGDDLHASGSTRVWDAATGERLQDAPGYDRIEYSRDRRRIITILGAEDHSVAVYDAAVKPLHQHQLPVHTTDVVMQPDESGGFRAVVRNTAAPMALSWDGAHLASSSFEGAVTVWDLESGETVAVYRPRGSKIKALAFAGTGRRLVAAYADGVMRLLTPAASSGKYDAHWDDITAVRFTPDGRWAASGGKDGLVLLWNTGGSMREFFKFDDAVRDLAFAPDSQRIAVVSGASCFVWPMDSTLAGADIDLGCEPSSFKAVSYAPDGRTVAISIAIDGGYRIAVFDIESQTRVWSIDALEPADAGGCYEPAIAYSPDGRLLATGGRECKSLRIWDAATGTPAAAFVFDSGVFALGADAIAWSPGGQRLATVCEMTWTTTLWNLSTQAAEDSLQVILDPKAYVGRPQDHPFILARRGLESHADLVSTRDNAIVARFPKRLHLLTAHPDGRTFAAASGPEFYLLYVEEPAPASTSASVS